MKDIQDKISNDLVKNHGLYTEFFFIFVLMIFYFQYILPLLTYDVTDLDPVISLVIGGFVFFSALVFFMIFPWWFKNWLFMGIEYSYLAYLKIKRKLRNE